MSNNIVQRLTELSQSMMEGYPPNDGDFTIIDSAIDEIQQLRLTIRVFEQSSQELLEYNNKLKRHLRSTQQIALDFMSRQDEELGLL